MGKASIALAAVLVSAFLIAPTEAQDKKTGKKAAVRAQKILVNNDRVRVTESVFKPGEENPSEFREYRITRVLKGSTTVERKHSNGKTEKIQWKEGGVYQYGPDTSTTKNVGKSEVTIYTVRLKQAKK